MVCLLAVALVEADPEFVPAEFCAHLFLLGGGPGVGLGECSGFGPVGVGESGFEGVVAYVEVVGPFCEGLGFAFEGDFWYVGLW